jgi:hypothetical protein
MYVQHVIARTQNVRSISSDVVHNTWFCCVVALLYSLHYARKKACKKAGRKEAKQKKEASFRMAEGSSGRKEARSKALKK